MKKMMLWMLLLPASLLTAQVNIPEAMKSEILKTVKAEFTGLRPLEGASASFVLWVRQPLDHSDTTKGFFDQRVFVQHFDATRPTVMVTEGYSAEYASSNLYHEELTKILNANQWVVEHRYFGSSKTDNQPWKYLTVENAANDHHRIAMLIRSLYKGPLITTGISKGGQTAIYHRAFFPEDADATVAYVAPINIAQEDPREIYFLNKVGKREDRKAILAFQQEVLKSRQAILPLLHEDIIKNNYTLAMSPDSTLDYMVLEYPFSFWQWGFNTGSIPSAGSNPDKLYKHLTDVIGANSYTYPSINYFHPFHYQAYTEVGYYGYDSTGLGRWLSIKSGYISNIPLAPKGESYHFNPLTLHKVREYVSYHGQNIIYIYGELDPWSASAAMPTTAVNSRRFDAKGVDHKARIHSLSPKQQREIRKLLQDWLNIKIKP